MSAPLRIGTMDRDRYDRSRRIPWLDMDSVFRSGVLIVGAGALGNEVAKNLALSGFRKMTIVDMDKVVGSNLNRCLFFTDDDVRRGSQKAEAVARGVRAISADAEPRAFVGRIEDFPEAEFRGHDVVLGCLDSIEARVHVNLRAYSRGITYIDGGIEGLLGKVVVVVPPEGACLQCGMNRTHARVAELRFSCTGKDVVMHTPRLPAEITTTSVVAAIMVREALKVVSSRPDMLLKNGFLYDGQRNVSEEIEIPLDPSCPVHSKH